LVWAFRGVQDKDSHDCRQAKLLIFNMDVDDLNPCCIPALEIRGHGSEISIVLRKVKIALGRHLGLALTMVFKGIFYGRDCVFHCQRRPYIVFG
jgi:hypothetical protein